MSEGVGAREEDGGDDGAVPRAFRAAAARWARGEGTPHDVAAMDALSLQLPLPPAYDAAALGFDARTRLPPAHALPLFDAAKNCARARFHQETGDAARRALRHAVREPAVVDSFPRHLGALPACAGLAAAARLALGRRFCVRWVVDAPVLHAAGVPFVGAAYAAGFVPHLDVEHQSRVHFDSRPDLSDLALRRLLLRLRFAADQHVLPAGHVTPTDVVRLPSEHDEDFNCFDLFALLTTPFYPHIKLQRVDSSR